MTKDQLWEYALTTGAWIWANSLPLAQVLAALVTAVATIALWRVTRVLAVETTTLAKMTAQPFVVCWLESSTASAIALNLTLRNTGNATAFDIKVRLTPALADKPDGTPSGEDKETAFDTSLLPPGQMLSIQGAMGPQAHDKVFMAKVSWSSYPGSSERETLEYTFEPKDGFRGGFNSKGIHDVAQELEKIRKQLPK
ncbi:MAG: hypothetical protein HWE30_19345 [Methylocystaceae bacterium]|nr:hypothetical protein [Methylocystaceae bacterium]